MGEVSLARRAVRARTGRRGNPGVVVCATGPAFRVIAGGTHYDDVYGGETFDARDEPDRAATVGYDDSAWLMADNVTGPAGTLVHRRQPPIRVTERIVLQRVETESNRLVFDVGRVVAGWVMIRATGKTGSQITLRYGERLGIDGPNDGDPRGHYNGRLQRDEIILPVV